ncbi:MAG: DUF3313 domain-containing protein [Planctomycetota bacterium]
MKYFAILLAAGFVAGCATNTPQAESGFFADYSKLGPNPKKAGSRIFTKPGIDLRVYDRLMIDPVDVRFSKNSDAGELDAETKQKIADAFRRIMTETIDPYYSVVGDPDRTVLRIRLAVTDVSTAKPGDKGDDWSSVGTASMEAELLDSMTGEILGQVVDKIKGSEKGGKAPSEWQHVEGAFVEWSESLLDYMDRQNERKD